MLLSRVCPQGANDTGREMETWQLAASLMDETESTCRLGSDPQNDSVDGSDINVDLEGAEHAPNGQPQVVINRSRPSCIQYYFPGLKLRYPYFMVTYTLLLWAFFLCGIIAVLGWNNTHINSTTPISPPQESYQYKIVKNWPSCIDQRQDVWRLVSFQFVHEGLMHIGGNTLVVVVYGFVLEASHPAGHILSTVALQMGVIFGAIGFTYVWPYRSLVGCSGGAYAVIGSCISHLIINGDTLPLLFKLTLALLTACQLGGSLLSYLFAYDRTIAHAAHAAGFVVGLQLGLAYGVRKSAYWKKAVGLVGIAGLVAFCAILLRNHIDEFPPKGMSWNPTLHEPYKPNGCCEELYALTSPSYPLAEARQQYVCNGDDIVANP